MTMGPLLTFDKSFLEMLTPDEVDELDLQFKLFVTPILVSEIQSDLKHPAPRQGKLPTDLVRSLARKLLNNHGVTQMHYRALGLGEITQCFARPVPMNGQVLLDSSAPNVMQLEGGIGTIYDRRCDWNMWHAWASGNFTQTDEYFAARWREQAAKIDVVGITNYWSNFCGKHLVGARTIAEVTERIDALIEQPTEQPHFLEMIYHFLEAPPTARALTTALMRAGLLPRVRTWAPYASSIARQAMIFCCCLTKKYVTSRPTNILDLQYLFYAPFGMIFVSHDRLHRQLWPAPTRRATFVWGADLKADLQRYVQARRAARKEEERGNTPPSYVNSFTPETSLIAQLRGKYGHVHRKTLRGPTGDFEVLPDEVKRRLRAATKVLDNRDAEQRGGGDSA